MFIDVRRRGKGTGGGREGERKRGRDRDREGEGERERERETSIGCLLHSLQPGIEPATQARTLPVNWTHNLFGVWDNVPTNWATWPGQAHSFENAQRELSISRNSIQHGHTLIFSFISFHLLCFFKASFNQYVGKLWIIASLHSSPPPIMELWLDIYWDPGSGVCASLN